MTDERTELRGNIVAVWTAFNELRTKAGREYHDKTTPLARRQKIEDVLYHLGIIEPTLIQTKNEFNAKRTLEAKVTYARVAAQLKVTQELFDGKGESRLESDPAPTRILNPLPKDDRQWEGPPESTGVVELFRQGYRHGKERRTRKSSSRKG